MDHQKGVQDASTDDTHGNRVRHISNNISPLETIELRGLPASTKSISWSCDAELAVATDDSVTIFLPEFPDPTSTSHWENHDHGIATNGHNRLLGRGNAKGTASRPKAPPRDQFSNRRQIPVSRPPLHSKLNDHLWTAAGLDMPKPNITPPRKDFLPGLPPALPKPLSYLGAGSRIIGSTGSTLDHVVALQWSPAGIGRNLRPVLGVLTASGCLAIYGDDVPGGLEDGADGVAAKMDGRKMQRDLENWVALWAVGEKFVVPDQSEIGERIVSFAWAREIGTGRSLLAYQNDHREVVVLAMANINNKWQVKEVARRTVAGPHHRLDPWDPDFTPGGSSFGLSWSPWVTEGDVQYCLLSYTSANYVGFRKISLRTSWADSIELDPPLDSQDWDGRCLFLGPDAFPEWETDVMITGTQFICRGVIVTPLEAVPFHVDLNHRSSNENLLPHHASQCGSVYPRDQRSTNPITGLIVHPPTPADSDRPPEYTLIRLSATATNSDWLESNHKQAKPQWAKEIDQIVLEVASNEPPPPVGAQQMQDDGNDEDAIADEDDDVSEVAPDTAFIKRVRIWGMAAGPGGGTSAVLVSIQSAHYPGNDDWKKRKCRVLFDQQTHGTVQEARVGELAAEGRLWQAIYSPSTLAGFAVDKNRGDRLAQLQTVFADTVRQQTCNFCGNNEPSFKTRGDGEVGCDNGHILATCAASGVAIQEPGMSRVCGLCSRRTLKHNALATISEEQNIDAIVLHGIELYCLQCGGKWLD